MDDTEKPKVFCHCCGKEVYRVVLPGAIIQQLAAMAMDADGHDLTTFVLATVELMHDPYGPQARRLNAEEEAELRRELERN